jgi:PAS domain S-box-containing protein
MSAEPDSPHVDPGLDDAVSLLLAMPDRERLLRCIIGLLRRVTGCAAVGVRLARGEDYPYYTTEGFSDAFVLAESSLCVRDGAGEPVRDAGGRAELACMCGRVLRGQTDPALPFFTPGGSFYTGATSDLLAQAQAEGSLGVTRNRCNSAGFETVALVPLRAEGRVLGLLQLNDPRRDRLDAAGVAALERLAAGVAMALSRQETGQALAEAEARYRAIFFANVAVKLLIDPDTGRIVEANPAACAFYGYAPDVLRGLSIWDINVLGPEKTREEMRTAKEEGRRFFRFTHRLADGTLREVEVYSGPVEFAGRTLLFSIVHDVTERVRAEQARERVEQMLRHDLRSPLSGIVGLAAHLTDAGLCPDGAEMAGVIRETAERLYSMVERNLDLLKIERRCRWPRFCCAWGGNTPHRPGNGGWRCASSARAATRRPTISSFPASPRCWPPCSRTSSPTPWRPRRPAARCAPSCTSRRARRASSCTTWARCPRTSAHASSRNTPPAARRTAPGSAPTWPGPWPGCTAGTSTWKPTTSPAPP